MKLHFEPDLDYQHAAIESVCDLFRGQEICRTEFTVTRDALGPQLALAFAQNELGIGNRLQLLDDELMANLSDIQLRNGVRPSGSLASGDFTVEMETGTGKTYVYLRTIFELNRRYGFQVRHRGALRGDQRGRVQDTADHRGALPEPLRQHSLRVLPI